MSFPQLYKVIGAVLLIVTFQAFGISYAQHYNFINYNSKQGLPSSEVYCTAQDSSGYIWFGTDAGVCKFDGTHFTKYTTENGLTDNTVLYIHVDQANRVWLGTFSGGICYYFEDSIYTIAASDTLKKMISYGLDYINSFYIDENERLWIGFCAANGIIYIDPDNNYRDIHKYELDSTSKHIVQVGSRQYPIYAGRKRPVGRCDIYLHNLSLKIHLGYKPRTSNRMRAYYDPSGILLFSFYNQVFVVKNKKLSGPYFMPNIVTDLYIDPYQYVWIASYKSGVNRYATSDLSAPSQKYFEGLTVSDCMYDREKGLWITTLEKGVYYVPSTHINRVKISDSQDPNLTTITSYKDQLFVGSGSGNIYIYRHDSTRHTFYFDKLYANATDYVYKICMSRNKMVVATSNLAIYNLSAQVEKTFKQGSSYIIIKDIFITPQHTILLAGLNFYLELDSNYHVLECRHVPLRTHSTIKTTGGDVYLGTTNGVWELRQDSFYYLGVQNPLLKYRTDDILEDSYHNLWFVTREVGVVFRKGNRYFAINKKNGLVSNQCSGIVEDKVHNIWISTYEGLSKIFMEQGVPVKIENYTIYNGLNSNEIKTISQFEDYILLVNSDGIDFFSYKDDLKNKAAPPIYIESIMIDGEKMPLTDTTHFFDYKSRVIEFYFSSLTYTSLGNKNYKYKLDGYDQEWHYTSNSSIRYTNLPAGEYSFLVYGVNNNGVTSKLPARISFVVTLPWWKTSIFYAFIYTFSIVCIIVFSITYTKGVKNKEKRMARIDYLLAESRLIALRAQMNPHFIFNVINSIQYYVLQNDKDKAYDYLARFSRLIRLVLDSSKYLEISLSREIEILQYYTELEKLRFGQELQIDFDIRVNADQETIMIPNMIIQPYVENAIVHGLLPKKKGARLSISMVENPQFLLVTVTDNGVGRAKSAEFKKSASYASSGMIITSERLKVIQTLSEVDVQVRITDLYNEHAEPAGTKVEITIPIK